MLNKLEKLEKEIMNLFNLKYIYILLFVYHGIYFGIIKYLLNFWNLKFMVSFMYFLEYLNYHYILF